MNRAGLCLAWGLGVAWACSSKIDLVPFAPDAGIDNLQGDPSLGGSNGAGMGGSGPSGTAGTGEVVGPLPLGSGGTGGGTGGSAGPSNGGGSGGNAAGTGGSDSTQMPDGGVPPACANADGDSLCDADDRCPAVADDGADRDQDGTPDACDRCADVNGQDDARDVDLDGIPDACDACGISVALGLSPLFYFPLDESALAGEAANLGSVNQSASYTGPIQRALPGVADPAGRAILMAGQQNGQFSRVTLLNAGAFPSTALTALFWVRTAQTTDYSIFSYALTGSSNEFGIIVEGDSIRVTLASSTFAADVSASAIADGTWHFVALTWQETSAQFYFDGEPAGGSMPTTAGFEIDTPGSSPVTGPLVLRANGVLVLGQDQDGVNTGFSAAQALQGGLDEVALYDRALSAEQIREIFRATTCGESCNGSDDDGDGRVDEGFLGSAPACAASSCAAIQQGGSAFGSGNYFLSSDPNTAQTCTF
ncbi:MAG TPA: LamG-like jellyroll fold domain-containing protein [Polyangiaceae bacterium]|nr:LamG-like jellyroll fold domain-containing protein [Polyangiaceae bacterium]